MNRSCLPDAAAAEGEASEACEGEAAGGGEGDQRELRLGEGAERVDAFVVAAVVVHVGEGADVERKVGAGDR